MTTVTEPAAVTRVPMLFDQPWTNPEFAALSIDAQWLMLRMRDAADTLGVVLTIPPGWAVHARTVPARLTAAVEELELGGWVARDPEDGSYLCLSMLAGCKLFRGPKWVRHFVKEYEACTKPLTRARVAAVVRSVLAANPDLTPNCRQQLEQMLAAGAP